MHRTLLLSALLFTAGIPFAVADEEAGTSRAFQVARRVAQLENQKDVPSRAVWLSNRVVKNSRSLAFHQEEAPKARAKKREEAVEN